MRKIVFIICFVLPIISCTNDSPLPTNSKPSTIDGLKLTFIKTNLQESFRAIHFINENVGYIAGFDGALYKTDDGGNSWIKLNTNTSLPLYDITFLNNNEGFVVGGNGGCSGTGCVPKGAIILHTTNGGQTWSQVDINTSDKLELMSINFTSETSGFAVGYGMILSTNDRGVTWSETKIDNLGGIMLDVKFINNEKGLIACTFGKLLKTIDGGDNWIISSPLQTWGGNTLALVNENLIFSAGYSKIKKSTDFGNTWTDLTNYPTNAFILKLIFMSENIGFALGGGEYSGGDFGHTYGAIYYTTDSGLTWIGDSKIHEIGPIISASFPTTNIGYAISGNVVVKIQKQ